ncbi:cellulose biosynthesis protein BcsO [Klebsiella sp. I138]|uniref:cellulose biosynthesis protein BcsO n=1 Tax=Klebsiella sp. I138 TaxID=2755385 RepID=UPI003DA7DA7E
MNHYDDLQRFKEKTRTQSLHFKDLSSHAAAREQGDWVILNQLTPGEEKESSLAMGGSVSLPIPQQVPTDMFHWVETEAEPVHTPSVSSPVVPTPVAPPPVAVSVPSEPLPVAATVVTMAPAPAMAVPVSAPPVAPAPPVAARPVMPSAQASEGYAHLFAAKAAEPVAKNKDQPLKSLLERIATCR